MSANEIEWGPWLDWDGRAEMPPGVARRDRVYIETRDTWEDACGFVESWVWLHTVDESAQDDGIIRYRLRADHPVYGKAKTVRVRIAVVVSPDGFWRAFGEFGQIDDDSIVEATGYHDGATPLTVAWVEADVPVPEAVTVQGEVSDG